MFSMSGENFFLPAFSVQTKTPAKMAGAFHLLLNYSIHSQIRKLNLPSSDTTLLAMILMTTGWTN